MTTSKPTFERVQASSVCHGDRVRLSSPAHTDIAEFTVARVDAQTISSAYNVYTFVQFPIVEREFPPLPTTPGVYGYAGTINEVRTRIYFLTATGTWTTASRTQGNLVELVHASEMTRRQRDYGLVLLLPQEEN